MNITDRATGIEGRALRTLRIEYATYLRYGVAFAAESNQNRSRARVLAAVISGRHPHDPSIDECWCDWCRAARIAA